MDVYGGQASGLDWYRLLSIYSTLGGKSASHETISDIGKDLAKLDGKHDLAIQGINAKLDSLIRVGTAAGTGAGTNRLSAQDLAALKQTIVDGMAEHAKKSAEKCAAPVVCDGESVLFTPDVKEVLASLVREKAAVLREVNLQQMARDIAQIDTKLRADAMRRDEQRDIDATWMEGLSDKQDKLTRHTASIESRLDQGLPPAADQANTLTEWMEKIAISVTNADDRNNPDTKAFATRRDALAEAVVGKLGGTDNAFRTALAEAVVAKMVPGTIKLDDGTVADIVNGILGSSGSRFTRDDASSSSSADVHELDNDDLYRYSVEKVEDMFVNADDTLLLQDAQNDRQVRYFSDLVSNSIDEGYTKSTDLTATKFESTFKLRYPSNRLRRTFTSNANVPVWLNYDVFNEILGKWLSVEPKLLDTDIYRLAHTFLSRKEAESKRLL